MSFSFPELLFICEVFLEVRRKVCIFDWVWVITIGSLMGPMAFPANGSSYLGYWHLYQPRGQPNLLPHWSNSCQPSRLYLWEMWEPPDQPHIVDVSVVFLWWGCAQLSSGVVAGSVCLFQHSPCQYFLKWLPVCSRTQHRGPVTPLFGFKTWKHKEQKATNWTK